MKNRLIAFLFVAVFSLSASVAAQTGTSSAEQKEITNLKEKLATKVLELKKKDQRGISGKITSADSKKIVFKTENEISYEAKLDDVLTKTYSIAGGEKEEVKISALKKNDYIVISGPVSDKVINANYIYKDEQFFTGSGKVAEVNKSNFYLKIAGIDKENYTIDIENSTKSRLLNIKTLEAEIVGFSKIKEGDTAHFVYKKTGNEKEKNRYSAQKLLVIPQEYFQK